MLLLVEEVREYVLEAVDLILEVVLVFQGYVLDLVLEELRVVHQFSQIVNPIRDVAVRVKCQKGHYRDNDSETGQGSFDQEVIELFGDKLPKLCLFIGLNFASPGDSDHEIIFLTERSFIIAGDVKW